MYKGNYSVRKVPEVVARSGSALVHFFSDDAYNMSGFNLTYRLNTCPTKVSGTVCSGHGVCIPPDCTCDGKWDGMACHIEKCPSDCGAREGKGRCDEGGCICNKEFAGWDCGQLVVKGYWTNVVTRYEPPGSASHGAAVWRDSLYIVGGETYNQKGLVFVYDFNGKQP